MTSFMFWLDIVTDVEIFWSFALLLALVILIRFRITSSHLVESNRELTYSRFDRLIDTTLFLIDPIPLDPCEYCRRHKKMDSKGL